jgi:hypothetical protein
MVSFGENCGTIISPARLHSIEAPFNRVATYLPLAPVDTLPLMSTVNNYSLAPSLADDKA